MGCGEENWVLRGHAEAGVQGDLKVRLDFNDWRRRLSVGVVCSDSCSGSEVEGGLLLARSEMGSVDDDCGEDFNSGHDGIEAGDGDMWTGSAFDACSRTEEKLAHSPTKSSESLSDVWYGRSDSRSGPTKPGI